MTEDETQAPRKVRAFSLDSGWSETEDPRPWEPDEWGEAGWKEARRWGADGGMCSLTLFRGPHGVESRMVLDLEFGGVGDSVVVPDEFSLVEFLRLYVDVFRGEETVRAPMPMPAGGLQVRVDLSGGARTLQPQYRWLDALEVYRDKDGRVHACVSRGDYMIDLEVLDFRRVTARVDVEGAL